MNAAMTDDEREARIKACAALIEQSMDIYQRTGCFSARGDADFHRVQMETLIRGRSAQRIAQMEAERGLA